MVYFWTFRKVEYLYINKILKKNYNILKALENIGFKYSPKAYELIDRHGILYIVEEFIRIDFR